jgi:hypothetical protein
MNVNLLKSVGAVADAVVKINLSPRASSLVWLLIAEEKNGKPPKISGLVMSHGEALQELNDLGLIIVSEKKLVTLNFTGLKLKTSKLLEASGKLSNPSINDMLNQFYDTFRLEKRKIIPRYSSDFALLRRLCREFKVKAVLDYIPVYIASTRSVYSFQDFERIFRKRSLIK